MYFSVQTPERRVSQGQVIPRRGQHTARQGHDQGMFTLLLIHPGDRHFPDEKPRRTRSRDPLKLPQLLCGRVGIFNPVDLASRPMPSDSVTTRNRNVQWMGTLSLPVRKRHSPESQTVDASLICLRSCFVWPEERFFFVFFKCLNSLPTFRNRECSYRMQISGFSCKADVGAVSCSRGRLPSLEGTGAFQSAILHPAWACPVGSRITPRPQREARSSKGSFSEANAYGYQPVTS